MRLGSKSTHKCGERTPGRTDVICCHKELRRVVADLWPLHGRCPMACCETIMSFVHFEWRSRLGLCVINQLWPPRF